MRELSSFGLDGACQVHVPPVLMLMDRRAHQVFEGFSAEEVRAFVRHRISGDAEVIWNGERCRLSVCAGVGVLVIPAFSEEAVGGEENPGGLAGLVWMVNRLLGPGGCPWDQEQTHRSLGPYLIEEAYELLEAIEQEDEEGMVEELGDVLLQPVMHGQMRAQAGGWDIEAIAAAVTTKLYGRHPHVFGEGAAITDSAEVLKQWDRLKSQEKEEPRSRLGGVPAAMPALMRAMEVSKRAARAGFEWPDVRGVWEKVHEEEGELWEALTRGDRDAAERELGDWLFSIVNIARWTKIDPETALRRMVDRFAGRFERMEELSPVPLEELSLDAWDELWVQAKRDRL